MKKALLTLAVALMAVVFVAVPAAAMNPGYSAAAVNTTGIDDMADTIIALLIALIPILLILGIWAKIRGAWAILPMTLFAVNTTGINDMADTIIALLIALIPILLILGIWAKLRKGM